MSSSESEFSNHVVDLMQLMGPVQVRAMFGGYGIFLGELMFGLIKDNSLYLKADKQTENDFIDKGLEPFTYIKKGKRLKMSYYQAPEETLEDSNEMITWANRAYNTALRAASKKT